MDTTPLHRIECRPFSALGGRDVYQLLALRQDVFIVEQKCIFQDIDDRDGHALHMLAWRDDVLEGYARLFAPGSLHADASFGRLVTASHARRTGLGRKIVAAAIDELTRRFGHGPIRINAQSYLRRFYEGFGFVASRGPYDEDGIPHYEMSRPRAADPAVATPLQASVKGH